MARLFFDNYIADDKTKIKTNFPYKNTLLNIQNDGGLNCASDGIQIDIGGTDSSTVEKLLKHSNTQEFEYGMIRMESIQIPTEL